VRHLTCTPHTTPESKIRKAATARWTCIFYDREFAPVRQDRPIRTPGGSRRWKAANYVWLYAFASVIRCVYLPIRECTSGDHCISARSISIDRRVRNYGFLPCVRTSSRNPVASARHKLHQFHRIRACKVPC
jgi:hypothetical protein